MSDAYTLHIKLPKKPILDRLGQTLTLDELTALLWIELKQAGLLGIYEGTQWTDTSHAQASQEDSLQLYFSTQENAEHAQSVIAKGFSLTDARIDHQPAQDWNAVWNESFDGAVIAPFFEILPNGKEPKHEHLEPIFLNVGAGFGAGTHETTQLCLKRLGEQGDLYGKNVLDFGSGSGILGIAAAAKGAWVDAVEIDELSLKNAKSNAQLNEVYVQFFTKIPQTPNKFYHVILANILAPALIKHASTLCQTLDPKYGIMILSGLLKNDLVQVKRAFQKQLKGTPTFTEFQQGDWFAIEIKIG